MKTPTWEVSPGALLALMNSRRPLKAIYDLWTITFADGSVIRWSGGDAPVTVDGRQFILGPGIERTKVRFTSTLEVDELTVTMTDIATTLVNGTPLPEFIARGGFDGAGILLEKAYWALDSDIPTGTLHYFSGKASTPDGDRVKSSFKVYSLVRALNTMIPRDVYQAPCLNVVYDPATCKVSRPSKLVAGTATAGTNSYRTTFKHAMAQAPGYFNLGSLKMLSGLNMGLKRTIRIHTSTDMVALQPWPFPIVAGDTFEVVPGCDGTRVTCDGKFSNLANFRGQPLIPAAETVL